MIPLLIAAQIAATDLAKAQSYFSREALTTPVRGCGNRPMRPAINSFEAPWFASIWIRADEPSLAASAATSKAPTWGFTVIPTWERPMVFRIIQEPDGKDRMVAKVLSGQGGYDPGKLQNEETRLLTPAEQGQFEHAVSTVQDVLKGPASDCVVVMDGTVLLLEQVEHGRYAIGRRDWSRGIPMTNLLDLLVRFAGPNFDKPPAKAPAAKIPAL